MPAQVLLFLLAAAVAAPDNVPADRQFVAAITVPLKDLDLDTEQGAALALERLDEAAFHACGGDPAFHPSYKVMPHRTVEVFRACREDAVARAVTDVGAPNLVQARARRPPDPPQPRR